MVKKIRYERFGWNGSGIVIPLCNKCNKRAAATKCKAYKRIPDAILKGSDCKYYTPKSF